MLVIAIEGVDGSGKATQTALLKTHLDNYFSGGRVKSVAFPRYDGPCGDLILRLLKTQLYAFGNIDQAQLLQSVMLADRLDAMNQFTNDEVIICDRYYMSGIVYGLSDKLSEPWLYNMHKSLPRANVQVLVDVDPVKARLRRPQARDNYEKDLDKQHYIRAQYLKIWKENRIHKPNNWFIINGDDSETNIHDSIKSAVQQYLNSIIFQDLSYAAY